MFSSFVVGDSKGWLAELESSPFVIVRIEDIGGFDGGVAVDVGTSEECTGRLGQSGWR